MEIKKVVAAEELKPATLINLVSIALDNYDDIFSDFDPSPYHSRILSDDFLKEVQKRYVENKHGSFEVRFSLPNALRSAKTEALIKKRLKDYFTMQLKNLDTDLEKVRKRGMAYVAAGFAILAGSITLATTDAGEYEYIFKLLEVLLVPLGWYLLWVGIEKIVETPSKLEDQRKFNTKFENANYYFISEEAIVQQISATATKEEEKPEARKEAPKEQPKEDKKS
ncbi:hypothetical protein H0O02_02340 [Candidatus Micrarchaeota archaeon]|nr:hypothetical protein [Candidatus Micrarchaeota archaeon]